MNPELAISIRDLADAAITRVHTEGSTPRDGATLISVLKLAQSTLDGARSGIARLMPPMEKAATCGGDASLAKMADDFTKGADALAETVALLKAVAAEPQRRLHEPYHGTPLHLVNRALSFTSPTWGSA